MRRVCAHCGAEFHGRRNRLYCAPSCQKKVERNRETLRKELNDIERLDRQIKTRLKRGQTLAALALGLTRKDKARAITSLETSLQNSLLTSPELVKRVAKLGLEVLQN